MKLFKFTRRRSPVTSTLLICVALLAAAVYGWDVPVAELLNILLVLVIILGVIMLTALLLVALFRLIRR